MFGFLRGLSTVLKRSDSRSRLNKVFATERHGKNFDLIVERWCISRPPVILAISTLFQDSSVLNQKIWKSIFEAPNDLGAIISRVCLHFFLPFSKQVNTDLPVFHIILHDHGENTHTRTHIYTHLYWGMHNPISAFPLSLLYCIT